MNRRSLAVLVLTGALVISFVTACSSDSASPKDAACSDASALKDSVNQMIEDVKSGNLGDAKDQISKVKSDFEALQSSTKDLAASERSSVQADLESVKATLGELTSASSTDDIRATLGTAESELKSAASSITKTLTC